MFPVLNVIRIYSHVCGSNGGSEISQSYILGIKPSSIFSVGHIVVKFVKHAIAVSISIGKHSDRGQIVEEFISGDSPVECFFNLVI